MLSLFSASGFSENLGQRLMLIENKSDKQQALEDILQLAQDDSLSTLERISVLTSQGQIYHQLGLLEKAIKTAQQEQQLAFDNNLKKLSADASKRVGVYAYFKGENRLALASYQQALDYYQTVDEPILQANLHNNIGLVHAAMGKLELALVSYLHADPLYQSYGSKVDKLDLRFNIAGLHLRLKRYDIAISMFHEIIERRVELGDELGIAMAQGDLGSSYKYAEEYEQAEAYMTKALNYYLANNSFYNAASLLHNLAELNNYLSNLELAIDYAKQGIKLSREQGHDAAYVGSLYSLATAYFHQGKYDLALELANKSNEIAYKMHYQVQINHNLALLSLIYAGQNKPKAAIEAHREFLKAHIEISNNELNTKLALFDSEQLKQQVTQLTQQQRLKELEIEKSEQKRNFVIIAIVAVLIIALLVARRDIERRSKRALESKVKQRTNELEYLMQELQSANNIKSQFLANMSHEIRTPLTTVIGQAEAIISGDVDERYITKEVEIIHGNSLHLLELTNNILDLSKIEANKIELDIHPQDLHNILQELANMFTMQANSKGLTFDIIHRLPCPFVIDIDGFRVKQVLINLCSNAIKFTQQGHVELKITQFTDKLVFKITDSGIGMSSSQLHNLFESFTQGDSSISRRFGGTGLGLCLSDQLAKIMGGNIEVESELNQGSVFAFTLPCKTCEQAALPEVKVNARTTLYHADIQLQGKILLADDHHDNRRLIARLLATLGLEVICAENGQEAVKLVNEQKPDVILMDIQMPEMDGIEAFKILRQQGYDKPIIALTANAMSHEIEHYLSIGFNDHLSKPIDREIFVSTISNYYGEELCYEHVDESFKRLDMTDLVAEFKSNLVLEQQDLILHIKHNDLDKLARLAHRIAGAAQMFSFAELSKIALRLEIAIKKQQVADIHDYAQDLLNEIDQVLW